MRDRRRGWRTAAVGAALTLTLAAGTLPARAQATSVTLKASPTTVTYGDAVSLTGAVSPPSAGETVEVVDGTGTTLAEATTMAGGTFALDLAPEAFVALRAVWGAVESDPVEVGVRASVAVRLGTVRLFDQASVTGTVAPAHPGERVEITLRRSGSVVATRRPVVGADGRFATSFRISKPGRYRAVATFEDADHLPARASAGPRATPLPTLGVRSKSVFVRLLEERLTALRYHLPGVNRTYGKPTGDAVLAFTKVQRMRRRSTVNAAVWRALASPTRPRARSRGTGFHIEVDQSRQVLYTVRDGVIRAILHVSTGAGGATRNGWFRVYRKLAGYSPNRLYYPSYFDGLRAVHGWPEVPSYPASHGCVRVPNWTATWVFGQVRVGTRVIIYR